MFVLLNIIILVYPYVSLNQLVMIRLYELQKRKGFAPRLVVEIQRFPHDVTATIRYFFSDGSYELRFPGSWTANAIANEVRHFVELVNSPNWLAEIKSSMKETIVEGPEMSIWL